MSLIVLQGILYNIVPFVLAPMQYQNALQDNLNAISSISLFVNSVNFVEKYLTMK